MPISLAACAASPWPADDGDARFSRNAPNRTRGSSRPLRALRRTARPRHPHHPHANCARIRTLVARRGAPRRLLLRDRPRDRNTAMIGRIHFDGDGRLLDLFRQLDRKSPRSFANGGPRGVRRPVAAQYPLNCPGVSARFGRQSQHILGRHGKSVVASAWRTFYRAAPVCRPTKRAHEVRVTRRRRAHSAGDGRGLVVVRLDELGETPVRAEVVKQILARIGNRRRRSLTRSGSRT
jgi:hypothetical protein